MGSLNRVGIMSKVMDFLLSGGQFRQRIAAPLHAVVWARRLPHGRSDVPEMRLLNDIQLTNRVALDVGAHAGNWTYNLSRRVGPHGTVVSYEALPHYGRALSLALRLLRVKNVRVRTVAVGDRARTIALRWRSESDERLTGRTHIDLGAQGSEGVIDVEMVSIDDDLQRLNIRPSDVAFVKIDVEGAELEVLRGASTLLGIGRPVVYLETEPDWIKRMGHSVEDVFNELIGHGYGPHLVTESEVKPTDAPSYLAQYYTERSINNVLFLPGSTPNKLP